MLGSQNVFDEKYEKVPVATKIWEVGELPTDWRTMTLVPVDIQGLLQL